MKLNVFNRKKTVLEKLTSTYDVKLDASASQLIMDVLAKLYDNPVDAAIREYVSNAYDANVEAGSTEPVHLHVPTEDEPYLEVSDTGNGLDYLGIVSVFANFGTSTKRDSNEFIGGFGIGSKSGLAISDKIHVSSVCNSLLNEFVIERKDGILQTRFIVENKETTSTNGTTVTIKVQNAFVHDTTNVGLKEYHYVIQGWSTKELIVTNKAKNCAFMNDNRVTDTFHKIPNTNTWLSKTELDCTRTFYANQHVRIGRVLYRIPDNIVRKLPDDIYEKIQFIAMVHDVPIGELKVNYAREKLDVSEKATIKKLLNIMTKAYSEYVKEYTAITRRTDIDAPTKLRVLRENQYPFNYYKCLEDCGVNENQKYPFKYKAYKSSGSCYVEIPNNLAQNELNDKPDLFVLDDKGFSPDTYLKICEFLDYNYSKIETLFPNVTKKTHLFHKYTFSFCDSAGLYWHVNSDTLPVVKIEDILKYMPDEDGSATDVYKEAVLKDHTVFDTNNKWVAIKLSDIPDNKQTHLIADNTNDYLDSVYDFVLPENNKTIIISTIDNDEIDWILKNKPNVSYFTKNEMDAYATTISDTIKPLLDNDNVAYLIKMFNINKQLANNIAMLNLDTKQDTEVYLKALYRTSRRCDPKTHNLSFDQKLFLAALVSNDKHLISKKDAAKIIKRLKLLFPDELKLIKDAADEIVHKVQL